MRLYEALKQAEKENLVLYGIQSEESDLRIHVCPLVKRLYLFPTNTCMDVVKQNNYPVRTARNLGLVSSMGLLIPPDDIPQCRFHSEDWFEPWWKYLLSKKDSNTSTKGKSALQLVEYALRNRRIPLRLDELPIDFKVSEVTDKVGQIKGIDARLKFESNLIIQVKYDLRGGHRELGGTGNLFIQIAERNHYSQY